MQWTDIKIITDKKFEDIFDFVSAEICPMGVQIEDYSDLVLGCTHFNYFKDVLAEVFPETTRIIDGSFGTVRHLKDILDKNGLSGFGGGQVEYYITGGKLPGPEFNAKAERYLKRLDKMAEISCGKNPRSTRRLSRGVSRPPRS